MNIMFSDRNVSVCECTFNPSMVTEFCQTRNNAGIYDAIAGRPFYVSRNPSNGRHWAVIDGERVSVKDLIFHFTTDEVHKFLIPSTSGKERTIDDLNARLANVRGMMMLHEPRMFDPTNMSDEEIQQTIKSLNKLVENRTETLADLNRKANNLELLIELVDSMGITTIIFED